MLPERNGSGRTYTGKRSPAIFPGTPNRSRASAMARRRGFPGFGCPSHPPGRDVPVIGAVLCPGPPAGLGVPNATHPDRHPRTASAARPGNATAAGKRSCADARSSVRAARIPSADERGASRDRRASRNRPARRNGPMKPGVPARFRHRTRAWNCPAHGSWKSPRTAAGVRRSRSGATSARAGADGAAPLRAAPRPCGAGFRVR